MDVPYLILVEEVLKVAKSVASVSALSVKSLSPSMLVSSCGLGRCVPGSPGVDLVMDEAVSKV